MNVLARIVLVGCVSIGCFAGGSVALAGNPSPFQDIQKAAKNPKSLFNNPAAKVITSGTGGHIAVLVQKSQFADAVNRGEQATVQVEATDPFKFYAGGAKSDPKAVLGNIAYETITRGHDLGARRASGLDITMKRKKGGVYTGNATVQASLREGDDLDVALGNVALSIAGKNNTWNSNGGKGYNILEAPSWATGTPAVTP